METPSVARRMGGRKYIYEAIPECATRRIGKRKLNSKERLVTGRACRPYRASPSCLAVKSGSRHRSQALRLVLHPSPYHRHIHVAHGSPHRVEN